MTIDITKIVVALIGLLSLVITGFVIPWLKSKTGINKEKITAEQRDLIQKAVDTAVAAAEQLYYSDQGKEKKAYVINVLHEQGYIIDPEAIDEAMNALIEATVLAVHHELNPKAVAVEKE